MKFCVLGALAIALLTPTSAGARSLTDVVLDPPPAPEINPGELAPPAPEPPPPASDQRLQDLVDAGRHWRIETTRGPIHVWVPENYDAKTAATVVFVHGYWVDVDHVWDDYRLPQQFALSGINAMFIVPEAPLGKHDTIAWPSLRGLVAAVSTHLDGVRMPTKRLVAVGHSGAYRTLAVWLQNEGLDTVVLLDAVYAEYSFAPWARESKDHRLLNIAYETGRYSDRLHRMIPGTQKVDGLPVNEGFPDARIIYAKTDVGHYQLVTDGVALPLALRAIHVPLIENAPVDLPLGLPAKCKPPTPTEPDIAASEPPVPVLPPL